jgi:hypothetical protein
MEDHGPVVEGNGDRLFAYVLRLLCVLMLAAAGRALFPGDTYSALLWLAGSTFCLGASYDISNVLRALLGKIDLPGGSLRMGIFGKTMLYVSVALCLAAGVLRHYQA